MKQIFTRSKKERDAIISLLKDFEFFPYLDDELDDITYPYEEFPVVNIHISNSTMLISYIALDDTIYRYNKKNELLFLELISFLLHHHRSAM